MFPPLLSSLTENSAHEDMSCFQGELHIAAAMLDQRGRPIRFFTIHCEARTPAQEKAVSAKQ